MTPLISVVIPTYNAPSLLLETLNSVFAQTLTDFEVVVINDGSTDDTVERLRSVRDRIRLITQTNAGIGAARNRGIDEARGKYVALLDHDDLFLPGKLAAQAAFLESHSGCSACGVPWSRSDAPDECQFSLDATVDPQGIVQRPIRKLTDGQYFLVSSSIMFNRERARGLRYLTAPNCIEDIPFQLGLFGRGEFGMAGREIQMIYRVHATNFSKRADYFYNGVQKMLSLNSDGAFDELAPTDRADLNEYFAALTRVAAVKQLVGGYRGRGLKLYFKSLAAQLAAGRWRFALSYPALSVMPRAFVRKRFRTDAV